MQGDLDGDGVDEIVAGYRGGGGGVNIYRLGADVQWTKYASRPGSEEHGRGRLRAGAPQRRQADRSRVHRHVDRQFEVVREHRPEMSLILASRSPRRSELLKAAGISFEVLAADIDETPLPTKRPPRTWSGSRSPRREPCSRCVPARVLGADTPVTIDGEILGKPVDEADALRMLAS